MLEVFFILFVFAGQSSVYILLFNRLFLDAVSNRLRVFVMQFLAPVGLIALPVAGLIVLHANGELADLVRFQGSPATSWLIALYMAGVVLGGVRFLWVSLVSQPRRKRPQIVTAQTCSVRSYRPDDPNRDRARGLVAWSVRLLEPWNQRRNLEVNEFDLTAPDLPEAFDGFSIVHLTDLHVSHHEPDGWHDFVIDQVHRLRPDLIILTGDLFLRPAQLPRVENILTRLRASEGVWAICGNHDMWEAPEATREMFARTGVEYIANRRVAITRDGAAIDLVGIEAPWDRSGAWREAFATPANRTTIVLSHTPDNATRIAPLGPTLMVAGHTHGGQIRLPVVGSLIIPSRYGKWFDTGWFSVGSLALYVNKGTGAVDPPIRLACRPEIARFTLRTPPAEAAGSTE